MTPKQMLEGQIAEFEMLAKNSSINAQVWWSSASDWDEKNKHIADNQRRTALSAEASASTFSLCANRLKELLKLKGWE